MIRPIRGPWRNYATCHLCHAETGKPCLNLTSLRSRMEYREPLDHPHRGRPRAAGTTGPHAYEGSHRTTTPA